MITYKYNSQYNSIELYFDKKPMYWVILDLKKNGWKWHSTKKCWFTAKNEDSEEYAIKMAAADSTTPLQQNSIQKVTFEQTLSGQYVSSVSIEKSGSQYNISSTNNQIICCDCKHFFSIHAEQCPFCGCPLKYVVELYFNRYYKTQAQIKQEQIEYKQSKINELIFDYGISCDKVEKLKDLDIAVFNFACDNAKYIQDINVWHILSFDKWLDMLVLPNGLFLEKINEVVNGYIDLQMQILMKEIDEEEQKEKIINMCKENKISEQIANSLINKGLRFEEVQNRIDTIKYYINTYPEFELNLSLFVTYSRKEFKEHIKGLLAQREYSERGCVGLCSLCRRERCIMD